MPPDTGPKVAAAAVVAVGSGSSIGLADKKQAAHGLPIFLLYFCIVTRDMT